ncbi:MAG: hypothetical protein ACPHZB_07715, partial [Flavobacteriales bacterium]
MLEFEFSRVLRVQTATPAFAGDLVEWALGRQGVELGGGAAVAERSGHPRPTHPYFRLPPHLLFSFS